MAVDLSSNYILQYKCNDDAANRTITNDGTSSTDGTLTATDAYTSHITVTGKVDKGFNMVPLADWNINTNLDFEDTFQDSFTIAMWVKPLDGQPAATQFFCGTQATAGAKNRATVGYATDGKVFADYGDNASYTSAITNAAVFPNGTTSWTHIVATFDETNGIRIAIDGSYVTLDGTYDGDMSSITMANFSNTQDFYVGTWNNRGGINNNEYYGYIDVVGIFDKELSQSEINFLYNSGDGTEAQKEDTSVAYNALFFGSNF